MTFFFSGDVWEWRGPAPFYFVTVPDDEAKEIKAMEKLVTYGWGMIPAIVTIGNTEYSTALWPKAGRYVVPLKAVVRKAEKIEEGDHIQIQLDIGG